MVRPVTTSDNFSKPGVDGPVKTRDHQLVPIRKWVDLDSSLGLLAAIWGCHSGTMIFFGQISDQDGFFYPKLSDFHLHRERVDLGLFP